MFKLGFRVFRASLKPQEIAEAAGVVLVSYEILSDSNSGWFSQELLSC